MTMQQGFFDNPFASFLEDPDVGHRASFFSRPETRGTRGRRRFFANLFPDIQNQFLGALGAQIRAGQQPTQTFENLLGGLDFNRLFAGAAPSERGQFSRQFAPSTRTIFR
jgi:hypothetical protein